MTFLKIPWSEFKTICDNKKVPIQMTMGTSCYYLVAYDGPSALKSSVEITDPKTLEQIDFETSYLPHVNKKIENKTTDNIPKVSVYEPEGGAATIVSHDFTDKCSWYQGAATMTDEVLSNTTGNIFKSTKTHWIDLENGRLYDEDNILAQNPSLKPVVKINDVIQTTGFTINPVLGEVTFSSPVTGVVKATFKYADKSWFIIKPKSGKVVSIKSAEVQFSSNVLLNTAFYFEAWVNHPTFGMIPVPGSKVAYKNAKDFVSACNEGQGLIPKWAGLQYDVHVFPFHYARPKPLKFSQGVEIRVYCKDHLAITGEFATATFYVNVDTEVL